MPILKNARHELFAQNLAKGMTLAAAYGAAGYRANTQNGWRAARNPAIAARIAELRQEAADQVVVTVAALIERAEAARLLAMNSEQPAAAVGAIREMGILAGVRVERRDNTIRPVAQLSDDELMQIARMGLPSSVEDVSDEDEDVLPN